MKQRDRSPAARCWLLLLVLALMGCNSSDSTSPGQDPTGCPATLTQQVMDLINEERAKQSLPALAAELRLTEAAQLHAEDMAAKGFMSHQGSDGSWPNERITAAGYPFTDIGENVAAGQTTAAEVVNDWMNSTEGHREMILSPEFEHLGVGHATAGFTNPINYWCVNFGASSDEGQLPADGCHP